MINYAQDMPVFSTPSGRWIALLAFSYGMIAQWLISWDGRLMFQVLGVMLWAIWMAYVIYRWDYLW